MINFNKPQYTNYWIPNKFKHEFSILAKINEQEKKGKITLSPSEKQNIQKFVMTHLGDQSVQKKLQQFQKKNGLRFHPQKNYIVQQISGIMERYDHYNDISKAENVANKLQKLQTHWESNKSTSTIETKDKMTLAEFTLLHRFYEDNNKPFQELVKKGVFTKDSNSKLCQKINKIFEQFHTTFNKELEASTFIQNGDLISYHTKKWAVVRKRKLCRQEKLKNTFITPLGHIVIAILDNKARHNKLQGSEIFDTYRSFNLSAAEFAISDVWRLDITKLLRKDHAQYFLLQKACENDNLTLEQFVQDSYQQAHAEIHRNLKLSKKTLQNDHQRRYEAGLADFHFADKGGHMRKTPRKDHFHKIHHKFMQGFTKNEEMICSEFALKSIIAAFIETDALLKKQVEKYYDLPESSPLSKELLFLNIPVDPRERLKYVHSGRLIDLLQKANCLQKRNTPEVQQAFFQTEKY